LRQELIFHLRRLLPGLLFQQLEIQDNSFEAAVKRFFTLFLVRRKYHSRKERANKHIGIEFQRKCFSQIF